jgi:hypothetical protein
MKPTSFTLVPFPGIDPLPFTITGSCFRQDRTFGLTYHLLGRIKELEIPLPTGKPFRRIGLWENTCFEFFIGPREAVSYWEFNLSPSGDWNVFRFKTYRQGLFEEKAFSALPFTVRIQPDSLQLVLEFDLSIMIPADEALRLAISTVLKSGTGNSSMWALTHPGSEADFHHKDGFIIKL